jgi:hypothetical protein
MFTFIFILFLFILLGLVVGAFFFKIITQTLKKEGDLSINFGAVICPNCQKKTTLIRPPTINNIPWGGGICSFCGCQMDKWGNKILEKNNYEEQRGQLENKQEIPLTNFSESGKTPLERVFDEND